jgi:hypothetical protein
VSCSAPFFSGQHSGFVATKRRPFGLHTPDVPTIAHQK